MNAPKRCSSKCKRRSDKSRVSWTRKLSRGATRISKVTRQIQMTKLQKETLGQNEVQKRKRIQIKTSKVVRMEEKMIRKTMQIRVSMLGTKILSPNLAITATKRHHFCVAIAFSTSVPNQMCQCRLATTIDTACRTSQ